MRDWFSEYQDRPSAWGRVFRQGEMPIFDAVPMMVEEVRA
jgi:hypothetical protein